MSKMKKSLGRAETVLREHTKLLAVINKEVLSLQPLIAGLLLAESAASAAAADAALAGSELPDDSGDNAIAAATEKLMRQARKLQGLRLRDTALAVELGEVHGEIGQMLPDHEAEIRQTFSEEWTGAVQGLEQALARRQALESLIGKPFMGLVPVPQRTAAAADLADELFAPYNVRKKLSRGLSEIVGWSAIAESSVPPHPSLGAVVYDSQAVYRLRTDSFGCPAETLVVDATFPNGILSWLCRHGDAVTVRPESAGISAAAAAARQMAARQIEADASHSPTDPGTPFPEEVLERSREAGRINQRDAARADPAKTAHARIG
jgi:hypothetical protein